MIAYITGASSGLGAYTAQALVDAGWTVVAGARSFTGETDGRVIRLPLDVTRDDSVRDFMERAKQIARRMRSFTARRCCTSARAKRRRWRIMPV